MPKKDPAELMLSWLGRSELCNPEAATKRTSSKSRSQSHNETAMRWGSSASWSTDHEPASIDAGRVAHAGAVTEPEAAVSTIAVRR